MKISKLLAKMFRHNPSNGSRNVEPYIEQFTKCDKCGRLTKCQNTGMVLNITISADTHQHFIFGLSGCPKKAVDTP